MLNEVASGVSREGLSDQQLFERYQSALTKLLLNSPSGRSADFYKYQLFPVLSSEEDAVLSKQREEIMKNIYTKTHNNNKN